MDNFGLIVEAALKQFEANPLNEETHEQQQQQKQQQLEQPSSSNIIDDYTRIPINREDEDNLNSLLPGIEKVDEQGRPTGVFESFESDRLRFNIREMNQIFFTGAQWKHLGWSLGAIGH